MEISKNSIISKINIFYRTYTFEYLVLCLLVFSLWFIVQRKYLSYLFPVIFATCGVIFYIIFNKYAPSETNNFAVFFPIIKNRQTARQLTTIFFLVFYCLSLLALLQGFYTKNAYYYIPIAGCAGIILMDIFLIENDHHAYLNLIKSYLLALNILFSNHIVYPAGISLPDLSFHFNQFMLPILNTGHISTVSHIYQYFPCHHILSAVTILISGLPAKMMYLFVGSLLISFGIFFIFIIGKKFVNIRFGCIAALIFCFLDYYLMYGTHPEHQAYNYAIMLIVFTVLLFTYNSTNKSFLLLFLIASITIIFTHHLTAVMILVVLFSLLWIDVIKNIIYLPTKIHSHVLILIFLLILFLHFMYISGLFSNVIQLTNAYQSDLIQSSIGRNTFDTNTGYDLLPLKTLFLNTSGVGIFIFLSMIGFLSVFRKKLKFGYFLTFTSIVFSLLLSFGILFRHVGLLPDRIYPTLQIFCLLFLCSFGIIWINQVVSLRKPVFSVIICISIIILMGFFSLSGTISGFETSLFVEKNVAYVRVFDTQQETNFAVWKSDFIDNKIPLITSLPLYGTGYMDFSRFKKNDYVRFDNFILKNGIVRPGLKFGKSQFIILNNDDITTLKSENMYYDNGVISLLNINNP